MFIIVTMMTSDEVLQECVATRTVRTQLVGQLSIRPRIGGLISTSWFLLATCLTALGQDTVKQHHLCAAVQQFPHGDQ